MNRPEMLGRLHSRSSPWDLLIIGGGASGVGCAVDAASRGYEVALIEQHDFGKGTSSRSTKLAHGGVRYLEQEQYFPRHGSPQGARHHAGKCTAPGERPRVRGSQLRMVGIALLWVGLRLYDVLAGKYWLRPIAQSLARKRLSNGCRLNEQKICAEGWSITTGNSMMPVCSSTLR